MENRVNLIQHALLGAYARNLRGRVGAFLILNRLFTLFFRPIGVAVYQKVADGGFQFVYQTFQDPFFLEQLNNSLSFDAVDDSRILHRVYNTTFFVSIFDIVKTASGELSFHWVDDAKGEENIAVSRLFSLPQGEHYLPYDNIIDVNKALGGVFNALYRKKMHVDNVVNLRHNDISEAERREFIMQAISRIKSKIVEKEYRKVWNSPLISPSHKNPSNIFFFMRTYTRNEKRFGVYNYDVRLMLSPAQKKDIENVFATIAESCDDNVNEAFNRNRKAPFMSIKPSETRWFFLIKRKNIDEEHNKVDYRLIKSRSPERNRRYADRECDEAFWESIKTPEGRDKLISSIEQRFGDASRSMSDVAFSSGLPHVEMSPFLHGGFGRVLDTEVEKRFSSPDLQRLVGIHYLFSAMSPKSDDLAVLFVPIFLSGAVWFVTGIIADMRSPKAGNIINDVTWNRFYHFYYDISVELTRNFRSAAKIQYLEEIRYTIANTLLPVYMSIYDREWVDLGKEIGRTTELLSLLGRVYPYDTVCLYVERNSYIKLRGHSRIVAEYSSCKIIASLVENSNFPKLAFAEFLKPDRVFETVTDVFKDISNKIFMSSFSD